MKIKIMELQNLMINKYTGEVDKYSLGIIHNKYLFNISVFNEKSKTKYCGVCRESNYSINNGICMKKNKMYTNFKVCDKYLYISEEMYEELFNIKIERDLMG